MQRRRLHPCLRRDGGFLPRMRSAGALMAMGVAAGPAMAAPVFTIQTPRALVTPDADNLLTAVSANSPADAWVVGTLSAHFDGKSWAQVALPAANVQLNDVVAIAGNDVWAVGNVNTGGSNTTVALNWNGTAWVVVATPTPPGDMPSFASVTATAANDVWIAGAQDDPADGESIIPLFEHFDGTSWSVVAAPEPNPIGFYFAKKISASAPGDVWAVGTASINGKDRSFTYHWNGSAWVQVGTPAAGVAQEFNGVVALSPTNAWAVGALHAMPIVVKAQAINGSPIQTLVEHWNGTAWKVVASPNFGPTSLNQGNHLQSIAAISPGDLWVAGRATIPDGSNAQITYALHGDGTSWTFQPTPDVGGNNTLFGAAVALPSTVWFVGSGSFPLTFGGPLIVTTGGG